MTQARPNEAPIVLEPVATARNKIGEPGRRDWGQVVTELVFRPGFDDALYGLEEFSHLLVLFWMHGSPRWDPSMSKTHPQKRADLPLVGILATRSPVRPNPLGLAVVKLLERKGSVLKVTGLDAIDGTPVLDVKPYLPTDSIPEAVVPDWVRKLHRYDESDQA